MKNKVRKYRESLELTQEALGKQVGVSRQSIISIEKGQYIPSLPLALKLSRIFSISVEDLFQLEE